MSARPTAGESRAVGTRRDEATGYQPHASFLFLGSIHPRDKQNVAHRLQLGARAVAYGEKDLVFQGPYPTRAVLEVTRGLLNLTYSQELVCRQRDTRAFEVRVVGRGGKLPPRAGRGKPTLMEVSPLPRSAAPHPAGGCRHPWWRWGPAR